MSKLTTGNTGVSRRGRPTSRPTPPLPQVPIEPGLLYTAEEAVGFLRSSRRTLEGWRLRGEGPVYTRVGRRVRYRGEALLAYLDERSSVANVV